MSNIDELIINAHLKQRQPLPLPWNKDGERRVSGAKAIEDSESRVFGSSKIADRSSLHYDQAIKGTESRIFGSHTTFDGGSLNQTVKLSSINAVNDQDLESKYRDEEPNIHMSNRRITSSLDKANYIKLKDEDKEEEQGYKPYYCEDSLPRSNWMPEGREGRVHSYSYYNSAEKKIQIAYPVATRSDTKAQGFQVKTRESPRCSVKVTRHMIRESKIGYSVPLISERRTSGIGENAPKSSGALLKQENIGGFKTLKAVEDTSNQTVNKRKELDAVLSDRSCEESIELKDNLMRLNDIKARNKSRDSEIDTELDNLLDVTSEAMEYPFNMVKKNLTGADLSNNKYDARKQNQGVRKLHKETYSASSDDKNLLEHVKVEQEKRLVRSARTETDDYDVVSQDISEQRHRNDKRKMKAGATENMDEILKFTCQMMEIKQQKNMSKKKHSQNMAIAKTIENGDELVRKESKQIDVDKIDYENVEELNRKSRELFRKIIQNRKKKCKKHTTLLNLDPESDRRRIRKQKERANNLRILAEVTEDTREYKNTCKNEEKVEDKEDDVFDISPAKNKESFSDSESDISYSLEHDYNDNKDIIQKNTIHETHRLKPAKSYTILKHDTRERRIQFRMAKGDTCDTNKNTQSNLRTVNFENVTRDKRSGTDQHEPRIVNEKNRGKNTSESSEKENEIHDDTGNENRLLNVLDIGRDKFVEIENDTKDNRHEIELGDLMYDSDTDTHVDSDYSSDQDYFSRPQTVESRDNNVEFPRPASNRTFILSNEANLSYSNTVFGCDLKTTEPDINDNELVKMTGEKKISKIRRFFNWTTCCVRPKSDN